MQASIAGGTYFGCCLRSSCSRSPAAPILQHTASPFLIPIDISLHDYTVRAVDHGDEVDEEVKPKQEAVKVVRAVKVTRVHAVQSVVTISTDSVKSALDVCA